jgi:phytanoyl-CoA dioxygenase PhyH
MREKDPWFESLADNAALSQSELLAIQENGFVVTPGPVLAADLPGLSRTYDSAVLQADRLDVKEGSTTTRVLDFVNRGPEFDGLYLHAPLLEAGCKIIKEPFRLSNLVARTLNPGKVRQKLHVDFPNDDDGWPMVGFIFMVDPFRLENGATCFLPGSQGLTTAPDTFDGVVAACGPAGSMLIYNGSVWHEHGPNLTNSPRRSVQGALIRRRERSATDWQTRMRRETLSRLGPLATYLLGF